MSFETDTIGGFPIVSANCLGCGKPLLVENAWMTDGCPCNTTLGVNSMNETRWRLLMDLQQRQSRAHEAEVSRLTAENERLRGLLHHCWVHSGYKDSGYDQMTSEQKLHFDLVVARKSAALTESEHA